MRDVERMKEEKWMSLLKKEYLLVPIPSTD